jgi:MFS superfamily sulfate permease-like transporter
MRNRVAWRARQMRIPLAGHAGCRACRRRAATTLAWLPHDLAAGLVLTTMLVPVGIAYAVASGVPGIYGLYATIVPLLAYALFGPSRILVLGPDSSLAALILAVVLPLSGGDPARAVALAGADGGGVGPGVHLRRAAAPGFITELLSKPIRYGYMNGIAFTVLISQLPKLFGFRSTATGPLRDLWQIGGRPRRPRPTGAAFAIGAGALAAILLLKPWPRIPGMLIAVVGATVAVGLFGLGRERRREGARRAARGPACLRAAVDRSRRSRRRGDRRLRRGAGVVRRHQRALAQLRGRTRSASIRTRRWSAWAPPTWRPDCSRAFRSAAVPRARRSPRRLARRPSSPAWSVRSRSRCCCVCWPDLLRNLPTSALAAVVIASAIGLFEFADLRRIFRIQRWEFWLSIGCFAGVAALGAIPGIGLAVVVAVIEFLWDGWRPHFAVLGRVRRHPRLPRRQALSRGAAGPGPGAVPLGRTAVLRQRRAVPPSACCRPWRFADAGARIIVAAEPVTSVDVTSADMLAELEQALREAGIELHFAEMKDPVKDKLKRFELLEHFGPEVFDVDDYLSSRDWRP